LWSYSPDANAWTEVGRNSERPAPREEAIAVWDTANAQLLVYGGDREGRSVDDLWAYRPVSDAWVELDPAAPWPAARFRHAAVWDPTGEQMLVFAGYGGGFPGGYLNDVWSYRPSTSAWTRVETIGPLPAPRSRHIAVWDAAAQRLLVWGGFAGGVDYLADLWAFLPLEDRWQPVAPPAAPPARAAAAAAWDPDRRQLLIQGGGGSALSDELWSYHEE